MKVSVVLVASDTSDGCLCPYVALLLCTRTPIVLCVQVYSSYQDTSQVGLESAVMASFYLITCLKPVPQMQSHSELLGIKTSTFEF